MDLTTQIFWILGFTLSSLGLALQIIIYILIPCSRDQPQKILTQLTASRLLNTLFEYLIEAARLKEWLNEAVLALYFQNDAVIICWMFVFTKNLYDDIFNVFSEKSRLIIVFIIIWVVTIPVGVLCPIMYNLSNVDKDPIYYMTFYKCYAYMKFAILSVNLLLFCCIFVTILQKMGNGRNVLKTYIVFFLLVSISSLQVLLNDVLTFSFDKDFNISLIFGVFNSYQVIIITAIFVMITRNACAAKKESFSKQLMKKFVRQTV